MAGFSTIILLTLLASNLEVYAFHTPVPLQFHHKSVAKSTTSRLEQPCLSVHQYGVSVINLKGTSSDDKEADSNPLNLEVTAYLRRLWKETAPKERKKIASRKASIAINQVKHIMEGEEYMDLLDMREDETLDDFEGRVHARDTLLDACNSMLKLVDADNRVLDDAIEPSLDATKSKEKSVTGIETQSDKNTNTKKKSRSVLFGAGMGALAACWVFSGNYIFTALFTLMTALGQLEFYRMVMNTGIYPARKISVLGACAMFVTALFAPKLHQVCLPVFASLAMIFFLTMRRKVTTISEIATTFTGMFYLGYIPSFWVRIRTIGGWGPTRLAPIVRPIQEFLGGRAGAALPAFLPKTTIITNGAIFIFWTWISIAFSDVGAYFVGKNFGRKKLGELAPAAGAASPNKTLEGFLGGAAVCACFATAGAWVQRWPYWFITGPLHGIVLGFLGLLGDLTASMLKRDAGLKDFGDLIPEHGGIMDRVDSFIFTAPYSWVVCKYVIPTLLKTQTVVPV